MATRRWITLFALILTFLPTTIGPRAFAASAPAVQSFDEDFPDSTTRDRLAGAGLQFVDDEPDGADVFVVTAGSAENGSWGALIVNGTDDFVLGATVDTGSDELGESDTTMPAFLEPDDLGIVIGQPDDVEDAEAGRIDVDVTDVATIADFEDADPAVAAGVSAQSAHVQGDADDREVEVQVDNLSDGAISAPRIGVLCFDRDGTITGSALQDFADDEPSVDEDDSFTGTVSIGDMTCDAAIAGATAAVASSTPATRPAAPRRTPTPVADDEGVTDEEEEYLEAVTDGVARITDASNVSSDLFADLSTDLSLQFDEDWLSDLGTQLQVYRDVHSEAQNLEPSDRQTAIQDIWLQLTSLSSQAADNYALGLATGDSATLDAANDNITEAAGLFDDLVDAVTAFRADPGAFGSASSGGGTVDQGGAASIDGPVADCSVFPDYETAQAYYAEHPNEQATIDPDQDGLACEVYFGRG